jgi:hypothetical protein
MSAKGHARLVMSIRCYLWRFRASQDGLLLTPWLTPFDDPIDLPKGRKLVTLQEATS